MLRDYVGHNWLNLVFPPVGFIVTNMSLPSRSVVGFYNKRGMSEQWIREMQTGDDLAPALLPSLPVGEVRLQLASSPTISAICGEGRAVYRIKSCSPRCWRGPRRNSAGRMSCTTWEELKYEISQAAGSES